MKKAFTYIELVFVIVVLGILSIGGTDMFLHIYNTYFESRTFNDMQAKTQLALDQISNRLTHRVKSSLIVYRKDTTTFQSLESSTDLNTNQAYRLEWIGIDNDSFRGMSTDATSPNYTVPGWSGFIDLDSSNGTQLSSPGGNTAAAAAIIASLSDGDVNLTTNLVTASHPAMIFPDAQGFVQQYGWYNSGDISLAHPVRSDNNNTFKPQIVGGFTGVANEVYEQYQLAFSAYALEYDPTTRNITLYYNYQPWEGETADLNANSTLFLENVSKFIFKSVGSILKIQLCVNRADHQELSSGEQFSLCKERAIF